MGKGGFWDGCQRADIRRLIIVIDLGMCGPLVSAGLSLQRTWDLLYHVRRSPQQIAHQSEKSKTSSEWTISMLRDVSKTLAELIWHGFFRL